MCVIQGRYPQEAAALIVIAQFQLDA